MRVGPLLLIAALWSAVDTVRALEPGHFAGPPARNCWRIVGFGHGPGYHAYGCCSAGVGACGCGTLPCGLPGCGASCCAPISGPGHFAAVPQPGTGSQVVWGCPQAPAGWVATSGPFMGDYPTPPPIGPYWAPATGAGSLAPDNALGPVATYPPASALAPNPVVPSVPATAAPLIGRGRMATPLRVR